ncbi:hypothetical protein Tco_1237039 [Tanacetum coccineum]
MEDPEQSFVEYASSRTDEAGAHHTVKNPKLNTSLVLSARSYTTEDPQCSTQIHGLINTITIQPKQDDKPELNKEEERGRLENINTNPSTPPDPSLSGTEFVCTKGDDGNVMFIEMVKKDDDSRKEEPKAKRLAVDYFDIFPTRSEFAYHKYLMCGPIPSIFLRNPIITEGCPSNLKIPCNIGHVHVENAYFDLDSHLNIMTRMVYNWIMRRKLNPRENSDRGIFNFTGRIKGMHVFVENFTYVTDFMIIEDMSSIIDPRLSQVIEQYTSLSDLEKEHTKLVYLRNEEDKKRGVEYVMSKILGFYKEYLELGPDYATGMDDEGEVTAWSGLRRTQGIKRRVVLSSDGGQEFGDGVWCGRLKEDRIIFVATASDFKSGQRGDGVAGIKRRRRGLSSNGVRNLAMASGRGRLKDDQESSTWRRLQDFKATPSQ